MINHGRQNNVDNYINRNLTGKFLWFFFFKEKKKY
jgi:hypothetical protein